MDGQLDLFRKRLPKRPYFTNDYSLGVRIGTAKRAIQARYIQPNVPWLRVWLPFDLDRAGAGYDWYDRGAPGPNIVVENRENLHAHLLYGLAVPVAIGDDTTKAARFAAAVEYGLMVKLNADPAYNGLLCKNPLSDYWNVRVYEQRLYDLSWLADYLDLSRVGSPPPAR